MVRVIAITGLLWLLTAGAAASQTVLTAEGEAGTVEFTMAELEALGIERVETTTPWTDGTQVFVGVPAQAVIDAAGMAGVAEIEAVALNDYAVVIPVADFAARGVLIATRLNGERMRVRDKGPLWIIYPEALSDHDALAIRGRMIWQLARIRPAR